MRLFGSVVVGAAVLLLSGCRPSTGSLPTNPSPAPRGFEGEWIGTTSQGLPIRFIVSADQSVTRLTIGFRLDSCAGTETSTDLAFGAVLASPPGLVFAFRLASADQVSVQAYLLPDGSVAGPILFVVPPACGASEVIGGSFTAKR